MQPLNFETNKGQPIEVREDSVIPAGEHNIASEVTVFPEAKLVIEAGAVLSFSKFVSMTILGKLHAVGTATNMIAFTGRGHPGLIISGIQTEGTEIAHASFTGGRGRVWSNTFAEDGRPTFGRPGAGQEATGGALQIRGTKNAAVSLSTTRIRRTK